MADREQALENINTVGQSADAMQEHVWDCHDELRRLRSIVAARDRAIAFQDARLASIDRAPHDEEASYAIEWLGQVCEGINGGEDALRYNAPILRGLIDRLAAIQQAAGDEDPLKLIEAAYSTRVAAEAASKGGGE